MSNKTIAPLHIENRILTMRGQKVMIDADLADLYGVQTKRLNEQVRRNRERFPDDFMFQLTQAEKDDVVANCDHLAKLKFAAALPLAFTEHGALMVSAILNTPRAVEVSVYVVRAFVQLREVLASNKELARQLKALEQRIERKLMTHDQAIAGIIDTLRQLMSPTTTAKRRIGFVIDDEK